MAEIVYVAVTWTAGDTITEAKMDNMVANDKSVDAHALGIEYLERSDPTTPATNKIHIYAKDKGGVPAIYVINDAGTIYELIETTPVFTFPLSGSLVTGTRLTTPLIVPKALTITKAYAYAVTVPTGAALIFDINLNGTSIWNATQANRLQVPDGDADGKATQASFDTTGLVEQDILTLDIDQVGSTIGGADAVVELKTK